MALSSLNDGGAVAQWRPEASDCRTSQVPVDLCVIVGCDKVGETASKIKRRGGELAGQRELMESEGKEEEVEKVGLQLRTGLIVE